MKIESEANNSAAISEDLELLYDKTRDISKESSPINNEVPFEQLLKELAENFSNNNTNVILKDIGSIAWQKLSKEKRTSIYKVLQELLINMKKHSAASLAILVFKQKDKNLNITYKDNGQGSELKLGNGLQNTENRIRAIGGSITFESQLQKGFKAEIHV
jgi:signal transduction histidine kinase